MHTFYNVQPGDLLAASRFGYWHVGIASDFAVGGAPTVISASKQTGRVVEEAWATFVGGGVVRRVGYPGTLPRHVVVARARAQIGRPWALLDNCEHVAARAHGIAPRSGQLHNLLATGLALLCVWASATLTGPGQRAQRACA